MRPSAGRFVPLLALAVVTALGCAADGALGPREPLRLADPQPSTRSELEAARARWHSASIESYDIEYRQLGAWGPGERVRISVRDGAVTAIDGVTLKMLPAADAWKAQLYADADVAGLFSQLEHAFEEDADAIVTTYDPRLGIPTRAHIDFSFGWADDEIGWAVDEFRRASR